MAGATGVERVASAAGPRLSPIGARDEQDRLAADPAFNAAYLDRSHPQHDWAVRKMASLIRQEHGRL